MQRLYINIGKIINNMCNTFTSTVSKRHNRLAQVVGQLRGQTVKKADVKKIWISTFPELANDFQWVILSDHCINHTNKGACKCAKSELALFERVKRGYYLVL